MLRGFVTWAMQPVCDFFFIPASKQSVQYLISLFAWRSHEAIEEKTHIHKWLTFEFWFSYFFFFCCCAYKVSEKMCTTLAFIYIRRVVRAKTLSLRFRSIVAQIHKKYTYTCVRNIEKQCIKHSAWESNHIVLRTHTQNLAFVENDEEDSSKTFGFAMEKSEKLCYQIYSGTI